MLRRRLLVSAGLLLSLAWFADRGPAQPPAKDQHGDKLPAGAIARLGTLRWRHDGIIHFAAFLPDGKSLISVGEDQKARIWDFPSGIELRQFDLVPKKEGKVTASRAPDTVAATMSKDSKIMATHFSARVSLPTDKTPIRVHEVASGKEIASLDVPRESYNSLYFSPDDKHLLGITDKGQVAIWNRETWQRVADIKVAGGATSSLNRKQQPTFAFSPDGKNAVFVGQSRSLTVIDVASGKEISSSGGASVPMQSIHFDPDGKHVYTVSGSGTSKWEIATTKNLGPVEFPKSKRFANLPGRQLSPDGKVIADIDAVRGKEEYALTFADAKTGQVLGTHKLDSNDFKVIITTISYSPSGAMVALNMPGTGKIELVESPTAKLLHTINLAVEGAKGGAMSTLATMLFSPDGKMLVTCSNNKNVEIWDSATGKRVGALQLPGDMKNNQWMMTGDQHSLITNMADGTAIAFDLATLVPRRLYGQKLAPVKNLDPVLQLFGDANSASAKLLAVKIALSADSKLLAQVSLDQDVLVWDLDTAKELAAFKGHSAEVNCIAFSPDGKILGSASTDTTALLWDLSTLKRPTRKVNPQPSDLERWWENLATNDAAKAFDAICDMSAAPKEAVAFIKERVKPAAAVEMKHIEELVGQLNDTQYKVREKANSDLLQIGERIVPALDKALAANPELEAKRRLEDLRGNLTGITLQGERLRLFRAIEILERIGNPEARQVLESLAAGAPGALGTTSAQAALKRF